MRRNSHLAAIAGFALAAVLFVAGGLLLWGSTYTHNMVKAPPTGVRAPGAGRGQPSGESVRK